MKDVVCVGEALIDLIGSHEQPLGGTPTFERFRGGSAANLAANLAGLGLETGLVAAVGEDGLGEFVVAELSGRGVDVSQVRRVPAPTTVAIMNRSARTAEFVLHRGADQALDPGSVERAARSTRLFHTTGFALTGRRRDAVLNGATAAADAGADVSIDMNWAPGVGSSRRDARALIRRFCGLGALVKASADDMQRLLGESERDDAIETLFSWGATLVVLTLGRDGSVAQHCDGSPVRRPAEPVDVVDATGAGDAYWGGFLWRWLDGADLAECADAGSRLASLKLARVGPLSANELDDFTRA